MNKPYKPIKDYIREVEEEIEVKCYEHGECIKPSYTNYLEDKLQMLKEIEAKVNEQIELSVDFERCQEVLKEVLGE